MKTAMAAYLRLPPLITSLLALAIVCQLTGCRRAEGAISFPRPETKQIVRTAQYLLRAHGLSVSVDGRLGTQTRREIVLFQRSHGLRADGILGNETWRALIVPVRLGDKGDAVRAIQELLRENFKEFNSPPLVVVDGHYGSETQRAVKRFQSTFPLRPDGAVGPVTWSWLLQGVTQVGFYD